jgi:hypothetical protein
MAGKRSIVWGRLFLSLLSYSVQVSRGQCDDKKEDGKLEGRAYYQA